MSTTAIQKNLKQTKKTVFNGCLFCSLAANNHTTAFVGYRKQRKDLMETFSELYEYRPDAAAQTELYNELAPGKPVPHLGLHAKTAVFDRTTVFVGSYNLDPRSVNLNTEIGFLVTNEELAQAVANSILLDASAGNSWQVRLNSQGQTEWVTIVDGKDRCHSISCASNNQPVITNNKNRHCSQNTVDAIQYTAVAR